MNDINLIKWHLAQEWHYILVLFLSMIVLGYFMIIKTDLYQYSIQKNQDVTLSHSFELKQKQSVRMNGYQKSLKIIDDQFKSNSKLFTTKQHIPSILESISKTGVSSGLSIELLAPLPGIEHGFYLELPIEICMTGTYPQLSEFFSRISPMQQLVTWHAFNITREKTDRSYERLHIKIIAKIYLDPNSSVQTKDPIRSATPHQNSPFQHISASFKDEPLDSLYFVGVLKEGTKIWALISHAGGLVTKIKVGDDLGSGRVLSIQDAFIEIEQAVKNADGFENETITINLRS